MLKKVAFLVFFCAGVNALAQNSPLALNEVFLDIKFSKNTDSYLSSSICKEITKILESPADAPWGFVLASKVTCNSKKNPEIAMQNWTINIDAIPGALKAQLCRPIKGDLDSPSQCDITYSLSDNNLTPNVITNPDFLRIMAAYLLDGLPVLGNNSKSKVQIITRGELPEFSGDIKSLNIELDEKWQKFKATSIDADKPSTGTIWLANSKGSGTQQTVLLQASKKFIASISKQNEQKIADNFISTPNIRVGVRGGGLWTSNTISMFLPPNMYADMWAQYIFNPWLGLRFDARYQYITIPIEASVQSESMTANDTLNLHGLFKNYTYAFTYPIAIYSNNFIIGAHLTYALRFPNYSWTKSSSLIQSNTHNYEGTEALPYAGGSLHIEYLTPVFSTNFSAEYLYSTAKNMKGFSIPVNIALGTPALFRLITDKYLVNIMAGVQNDFSTLTWYKNDVEDGTLTFSQLSAYLSAEIIL